MAEMAMEMEMAMVVAVAVAVVAVAVAVVAAATQSSWRTVLSGTSSTAASLLISTAIDAYGVFPSPAAALVYVCQLSSQTRLFSELTTAPK